MNAAQPDPAPEQGGEESAVLGRYDSLEFLDDQPPFAPDLFERLGLRGLHCGSSYNLWPGWLNTDLKVMQDESGNFTPSHRLVRLTGGLYYLMHDLTEPLPCEDECFDWAYSEHFIEHVRPVETVRWLREIRRLLRPGGFVRISTPSLRRYAEGYLDPENRFFAEHRERLLNVTSPLPSAERRAWWVNQIFRLWGHIWIYDLEEVRHLAGRAGFAPEAVVECSFSQGREREVSRLDQEWRSDESLYVEITKT